MEIRQLGHSGLKTPPLVFDGNVLGWTFDTNQTCAMLDEFTNRSGVMIDTTNYNAAHHGCFTKSSRAWEPLAREVV